MKFLLDFFPIALFFLAFKLFDIYTATAVAIAATLIVKRTERGDAMLMHMTIGGALQALDTNALELLPA